jgi:putative endonuclease
MRKNKIERGYCVYILASKSRVLYVGVTGNLYKRVFEHKQDVVPGFTTRYRIHRLVYFEQFTNISSAITREKELKGWRREKKIALLERENPLWEDLAERWYEDVASFFGVRKADPSPRSG